MYDRFPFELPIERFTVQMIVENRLDSQDADHVAVCRTSSEVRHPALGYVPFLLSWQLVGMAPVILSW